MRRVISFLGAGTIFGGGAYLLAYQVLVSRIIMGKLMLVAATLIAVGGAWLAGDFILPLLRKRTRREAPGPV
jgi:multisubunit Na+/H+ antiporter MnhC subunit